jgi:hypothetical protein
VGAWPPVATRRDVIAHLRDSARISKTVEEHVVLVFSLPTLLAFGFHCLLSIFFFLPLSAPVAVVDLLLATPPPPQLIMSAILSADDLNDFISPGVACIKPIETLPAKAEDSSVCP